jgi:hypothetical protein
MSRYIPKKILNAAPCCEHCTPDDYHSVHHIIPYGVFNSLHDPHTDNIIKVCRKCHIKMQFMLPKHEFQSNYDLKKNCAACGHSWNHTDRLSKKTVYCDNEFKHPIQGWIVLCDHCARAWRSITTTYREHLQTVSAECIV